MDKSAIAMKNRPSGEAEEEPPGFATTINEVEEEPPSNRNTKLEAKGFHPCGSPHQEIFWHDRSGNVTRGYAQGEEDLLCLWHSCRGLLIFVAWLHHPQTWRLPGR